MIYPGDMQENQFLSLCTFADFVFINLILAASGHRDDDRSSR